jgi:hypothetical protein
MSNRRSSGSLAAATLAALLCWAPTPAQQPKAPPKTTHERAEREMLRLRNQIKNARMRLENGIQGVGEPGVGSNGPVTPARLCCSVNIQKLAKASTDLKGLIGELAACYEKTGDENSAMVVPLIMTDIGTLDRTVEAWANAPTGRDAYGGMGAMTQAYLQLRDDMDKIQACPPVEGGTKTKVAADGAGQAEPSAD